ncbi:MAG: enoyl-ACP reductase [Oscillospiraceae bacterium]|nr:enoyl-ACP reductase [Oscillospiraceae bacterium]
MILKGKKILIMGLRNKWSIAWGAAQAAYDQGAQIIFTYSSMEGKEKLEHLIAEIPNSTMYPCDVDEDSKIEKVFKTIKKEHGNIDGILHSIAHANAEDLKNDFINTTREGFSHANDISAYSLVAVCRYAKEILNPGSSVVSLTYIGSEKVLANYNVMGVAKAALECSIRYLADNLGKDDIRINAVSAGPIKTLSAKGIKDFSSMQTAVAEKAPLKRNVTAYEVGNVVAFLMSNMSASITGEVIHADNGFSIMGI